jgi:hypothetical protein
MYHEWGRSKTMPVTGLGAYILLVRKRAGNKLLGRRRHRWVNDIKMDLGEVVWGGVNWIGVTQDRDKWRALVSVVMNFRVP